ncbi:hypothetical protein, conserved in T.vivax [Trypanosoma vivax Y486]|uniref:Uncharacterized protein n=1 Tax=Trypanosoma vivax (strain Y486) TaxID=1055687 RepID=F9WQY9_TRYVY|nr:hypothetical protein, conserved in T.vivax [Trypanosoma vivax Y486]|eukprot:CCD19971.1 hypothetical protein, conserved in T.vivax [Trypanosoma vivax Y486]
MTAETRHARANKRGATHTRGKHNTAETHHNAQLAHTAAHKKRRQPERKVARKEETAQSPGAQGTPPRTENGKQKAREKERRRQGKKPALTQHACTRTRVARRKTKPLPATTQETSKEMTNTQERTQLEARKGQYDKNRCARKKCRERCKERKKDTECTAQRAKSRERKNERTEKDAKLFKVKVNEKNKKRRQAQRQGKKKKSKITNEKEREREKAAFGQHKHSITIIISSPFS